MSTIEFWEERSSTYDAKDQGDLPRKVIRSLEERGCFTGCVDMLEIGSGPGTYSLLLSGQTENLYCLDPSQGMMNRLMSDAGSSGIDNIIPIVSAWPSIDTDRRFDVVISPLCPGSSSSGSIQRMEELSEGPCAIVTWHRNHGDDLLSEVRSLLGLLDPLLNRGTGKAYRWLKENGRDAEAYTLEEDVHYEDDPQEIISSIIHDLDIAIDDDISEMISQCVSRHVIDGRFVMDAVNSLDVILWNHRH